MPDQYYDPTSRPTPKQKKPRQRPNAKWFDDEYLRREYTRERRQLASRAAQHERDLIERARQDLRNSRTTIRTKETVRQQNMVAKGLIPRLTAVLHSWGVTVPVKATPVPSHQVGGFTDFKSITIKYNRVLIAPRTITTVDEDGDEVQEKAEFVSDEDIRQAASEMRGLFYHEAGHIRFTVSLPDLLKVAPTFRHSGVTRRANGNVDPSREFHHAWNVLEDQRMEQAVTDESPVVASYLTALILRMMAPTPEMACENYPVLAGRYYLPSDVRRAAAKLWDEAHAEEDLDIAVDSKAIRRIVRAYMTADDPVAMLTQVGALCDVMTALRVKKLATELDPAPNRPWREEVSEEDIRRIIVMSTADEAKTEEDDEQEEIEVTPEDIVVTEEEFQELFQQDDPSIDAPDTPQVDELGDDELGDDELGEEEGWDDDDFKPTARNRWKAVEIRPGRWSVQEIGETR